jgi:hypothetical protein
MSFLVEVEHRFRAVQGLPSPVRAGAGLPGLASGQGVEVTLRAGVTFADGQLTERGWFFDTDSATAVLRSCGDDLAAGVWTRIFSFRPTFELVAREIFDRIKDEIPQLAYVELRDETFGVTTRYVPGP